MTTKILALVAAQACYWFATLVGISLSAIVGMELAPHTSLATLPFALNSLGALACTYPLSVFMQRHSRRKGLRLGSLAGAFAATLSVVALQQASFMLFCMASLMMGCYQASSVFYRLAAMDEAPIGSQAKAVSWVLCGSLLAALLGPVLAHASAIWDGGTAHSGAYALVAIFAVTAYFSLSPLGDTHTNRHQNTPYSVSVGVWQLGAFRRGLFNTALAQFLMMLLMVIAPLAMYAKGFTTAQSTAVIGWHLIGMFLPSFLSGGLVDRYGSALVIICGYVLFGVSAVIAISGEGIANYYLSLFLLGTAWNLVYVAGTSQYNSSLAPEKKARAQGIAELLIALAATSAVFTGGVLINSVNWAQINGLVLGIIATAMTLNFFTREPSAT